MKPRSRIRDWLVSLRVCRHYGGAQADYYEEVFDRWMRMFGPDLCLAPAKWSYPCQHKDVAGMLNNWQNTETVNGAAHRIAEVIPFAATQEAYWSRVSGDRFNGFIMYINGTRYAVFENEDKKRRRLLDLLMLHRIISTGKVYDDTVEGVGKIMESMNDRKDQTPHACA